MKWRNYGLWVSVASILYMVFKDLGIEIDLSDWQTYVTALLGVLATLGIISNPEKGKGFFDRIPTPKDAVLNIVENVQAENTHTQSQPNTDEFPVLTPPQELNQDLSAGQSQYLSVEQEQEQTNKHISNYDAAYQPSAQHPRCPHCAGLLP